MSGGPDKRNIIPKKQNSRCYFRSVILRQRNLFTARGPVQMYFLRRIIAKVFAVIGEASFTEI